MRDLFGGHDVLLAWGVAGAAVLASHVEILVVVDVLSFSTAVDIAVSRGAGVFPHPARDQTAPTYARSIGAMLASSRRQGSSDVPYSLSPASLLSLPPGTRLVLPSPNGSAIATAGGGSGLTVISGCLRNALAVAQAIKRHGTRTGIIAAGELWPDGSLRPALEDLLGAGAILSDLPWRDLSPDARAAVAAFRAARVPEDIADCPSGRELIEAGFARDVEIATAVNVSDAVPLLADGAFRSLDRAPV